MAVAVSPWVWVAVAAYSTWLANTLASQAGGARARAEEARAQAAQAEQTAKNLQTQLDSRIETTIPLSQAQFQEVRQRLGIEEGRNNIAVVGRVSSGKTSLINSCRGLRPPGHATQDPGNPKYSAGTVGSEEIIQWGTEYRDLRNPTTSWWDMAGTGDMILRKSTYYNHFDLGAYDTLLVLHDRPFSRSELGIIIQYHEQTRESLHNPRIFAIRTKSDQDLANIQRDEGLTGEKLVQRFKEGNTTAVETLLSEVNGLQDKVIIRHVSSDALYYAFTGENPGENSIHFLDELDFLQDLGLNPVGPPVEPPYVYEGSISESDNEDES